MNQSDKEEAKSEKEYFLTNCESHLILFSPDCRFDSDLSDLLGYLLKSENQ